MAPKMKKILFYCQSSLGIGHTIRSLRIAEGLIESFEVHYLDGGERIPGLEYPPGIHRIELPAILSDPDFNTVRAVDPEMDIDSTITIRRNIILEAYERLEPETVLVELYPFGRGRFRAELDPLLELAKDRGSKVVCSVRDILTKRRDRDEFERKVVTRMNRFFDLLLVHSDPDFQRLDESFGRLNDINAEICYTGYVVPEVAAGTSRENRTIIASIGGGRFGHELAEAVVNAAPLLADRIPHQIELYTGPFCPAEVVQHLHQLARDHKNLRIARFTPDLHHKLMTTDLSISMGGYNTMMNVIATGVRAMIMGCTNNGGMDQLERVSKLAALGAIRAIGPGDLEPAVFSEKIINCLNEKHTPVALDINGVTKTARALKRITGVSGAPQDQEKGEQKCVA